LEGRVGGDGDRKMGRRGRRLSTVKEYQGRENEDREFERERGRRNICGLFRDYCGCKLERLVVGIGSLSIR